MSFSTIELNISDYIKSEISDSTFCSKSRSTCCTTDLFDLLNVVNKPLLHKLSGQSAVYSEVSSFVAQLKYRAMLLIDINLFNVYRDISDREGGTNFISLFNSLYVILHRDIRSRLAGNNGDKLDIREKIMEALSVTKNEVICLSRGAYDDVRFSTFVTKLWSVFDISILLYRKVMQLQYIVSQIQDIDVSQRCIDDLLTMTLCGLCAEKLDFTIYNNRSSTYSNVIICPKYCYNVIRQCLSYFLHLVRPLRVYRKSLERFSKQYRKDLIKNAQSFWADKNTTRVYADLISSIKRKSGLRGQVCRDPEDIKEILNQDDYLLDDQDKAARKTFATCLTLGNQCRTFGKRSNLLFNDLLESIDRFNIILKTIVSPDYFIEKMLAKPCENINYQRCWNGEEIGQYHHPIVPFRLNDPRFNTALSSVQNDTINALSALIYAEAKNLTTFFNQRDSSTRRTSNYHRIEGSGGLSKTFTDDEDYRDLAVKFPKVVIPTNGEVMPPTAQTTTPLDVVKDTNTKNISWSETILQELPKKGHQIVVNGVIQFVMCYLVAISD